MDKKQVEQVIDGAPKFKPSMSSTFLSVCMAINVVVFVVGWMSAAPWMVCALSVGIAASQLLYYMQAIRIADLKSSVALLMGVTVAQHNERVELTKQIEALDADYQNLIAEQPVTDDGTKQD